MGCEGIRAFATGLSLTLLATAGDHDFPDIPGVGQDLAPEAGGLLPSFAIQFVGGGSATSREWPHREPAYVAGRQARPVIVVVRGAHSTRDWLQEFWIEPLPVNGALVSFEWPAAGLSRAEGMLAPIALP